jgi:hypothetical protein
MHRAFRLGLVVILLAAAGATALFFVRPHPQLRYAGSAAGVAATVALRLDGPAPPSVTVDLGNGVRVIAARLP